ncbi:MAG: hypothetical protein IID18_00680 [Nitrospinae bacterium]|nr:hypothetical protein [Nitrospinota bacterium]
MVKLMGIPIPVPWLAAFMVSAVFLAGCGGVSAFAPLGVLADGFARKQGFGFPRKD